MELWNWDTLFLMPDREESTFDQKHIRVSVQVAVMIALFFIGAAAAGAAWAQNVTNHLASVDKTLGEMNEGMKKVQEVNVIQERTQKMENRLQLLEEWRFSQARVGSR